MRARRRSRLAAELWLLAALRKAPLDGVERLAVWARARSMAPAEVARAAVMVRR